MLEKLITKLSLPFIHLSPVINFNSWEELAEIRGRSRDMGSEGIDA